MKATSCSRYKKYENRTSRGDRFERNETNRIPAIEFSLRQNILRFNDWIKSQIAEKIFFCFLMHAYKIFCWMYKKILLHFLFYHAQMHVVVHLYVLLNFMLLKLIWRTSRVVYFGTKKFHWSTRTNKKTAAFKAFVQAFFSAHKIPCFQYFLREWFVLFNTCLKFWIRRSFVTDFQAKLSRCRSAARIKFRKDSAGFARHGAEACRKNRRASELSVQSFVTKADSIVLATNEIIVKQVVKPKLQNNGCIFWFCSCVVYIALDILSGCIVQTVISVDTRSACFFSSDMIFDTTKLFALWYTFFESDSSKNTSLFAAVSVFSRIKNCSHTFPSRCNCFELETSFFCLLNTPQSLN